jgi:nuclear pore complex protein Nup54
VNYPFRAFFYNPIPDPQLAAAAAAQHGTTVQARLPKPAVISDRLWQQTLADNPRPDRWTPVMAVGFEDLKERAAWQDGNMAAQLGMAEELAVRLGALLGRHDPSTCMADGTAARLAVAIRKHADLSLRIIRVMRRMEVLRRAGTRCSQNEQEMLRLLQQLLAKLQQPPLDSTSMRVFAFQLDAVKCSAGDLRLDAGMVEAVLPLLEQQQAVLSDLVKSALSMNRDLDVMLCGYQ